jgi:hypothetical protein
MKILRSKRPEFEEHAFRRFDRNVDHLTISAICAIVSPCFKDGNAPM